MSGADAPLPPYCARPGAAVLERAAAVRAALFDIDGVLTDGTVYVSAGGEGLQAFHIHDGKGMRMLLEAGLEVAWITARGGGAVQARAEELGVRHLIQGRTDKARALAELSERLGVAPQACAYTGDDLIDLEAIRRAGLGVAVADAHPGVIAGADWVTERPGGRGAAREVSELLLLAQDRLPPAGGG
ncbi:KdsC family phosphatase [Halorhodospira neutriphila]|uniref:3-deoxy-D-manno-octulosonate 8-phosphate phosphatase KdsC n=1 Tax=Halorhodospira neutriphila TaxID=168379 RepID=A0ABS1E4W7_9GAMM|nr:HAD hydrolase family protein [Halorhodospira neutriphila]MBK1726545.1 phenylphosphate carboxylase subunit delta [Halorhodospira neutriphila]